MQNRQTTTRRSSPAARSSRPDLPPAAPVTPQPPRSRRRPGVVALGLALVCVGGLLAAWFASSSATSAPVLVINRAVQAGQTLTAEDLTVATLSHDPAVGSLPSSQRQQAIGQYAAVPLLKGQLVTPDSITSVLTPPAGTSLVGVAVTPTQLPSQPLTGGQRILIVATANAQDDPPTKPPASGIRATVVNTAPVLDTDTTVVNVTVDADLASTLASQVATGRIAIIVLTPGTGG